MSIPKDNGRNRQYGFVTYKYQKSVPYALSVFSGTKLFNRELRLNNRSVNRMNNSNNNMNNQFRGQAPMEPMPILPNIAPAHQYQIQNPFGNAALRGASNMMGTSMNHMMPSTSMPKMELPTNVPFDLQALIQLSAQMLPMDNGFGQNSMGNKHQSKMTHRHENRSHNQNSNYTRDRDRRNDRRQKRSRSRSIDRMERNNEWIRNGGRDNRDNRSDNRRDRNNGGGNRHRRR